MQGSVSTSLIDRLAARLGYAKALPQPGRLYRAEYRADTGVPTYPLTFGGWPDRAPPGQAMDDQGRQRMAFASSWFYSDVNIIASEASVAELEITRQDAETSKVDIRHPLERVWNSPNTFMGRSFLVKYWTWQMYLSGKAFLYFAPQGSEIKEIWPIPSAFIRPVPDPKQVIARYDFQIDKNKPPIPIPTQYICYSRFPHPFDPLDGMSPIVAAFAPMALDRAMALRNMNFFSDDNAIPTAVISTRPEMLDNDFRRLQAELAAFYGGGKQKSMLVRGGDITVDTLAFSPEQLQFVESRVQNADEVDRVLGFPAGYWKDSANRATANHARGAVISGVVWPLLEALSQDLDSQTLPFWYGDHYRAGFRDIRVSDRALDLQEFTTWSAVLTVNELRQRIQFDPFPDDDPRGLMLVAEIATGAPTTGTPAEALVGEASPTPAAALQEAEPPETAPPQMEMVMEMDAEAPLKALLLDLDRWEAKALKALKAGRAASVAFVPDALADTDRMALQASLVSAATREEVRAVFDGARFRGEVKAGDHLTPAERQAISAAAEALGTVGAAVARQIRRGDPVDLADLPAALRQTLVPVLMETVRAQVAALATDVGVPIDPAVAQTQTAAWVAQYTPELVNGITATTADAVQGVVSQYVAGQVRRADLVSALVPLFGKGRAETIALTEVTRASSQASGQYGRYLTEMGIAVDYVWRTNNDARVCPVCGPRHETVVTESDFPPAHTRCRCVVTVRPIGGRT